MHDLDEKKALQESYEEPLDAATSPNQPSALGIADLVKQLEKLGEILKRPGRKKHFTEELDWIEKRHNIWTSHAWYIALVGITSSGKSTLLNALLGAPLLPSRVAPSSNILIICRKQRSGKPRCLIHYDDGRRPLQLRGEKPIQRAIRSVGDENNNPRNRLGIREIELFSPHLPFDHDIVLIDTPGLDANNLEFHERLTMVTLLPTVDAVVYLQTLKSNSEEKSKEFLGIIRDQGKPVIFVQTQTDSVMPKLGERGREIKSTAQVCDEHRNRATILLDSIGFALDQVPVVQVSALKALRAIEAKKVIGSDSGIPQLVTAISHQIRVLKPKLMMGRLAQFSRKVRGVIELHGQAGNLEQERFSLDRSRDRLLSLRESLEVARQGLERKMEEVVSYNEHWLAEMESKAEAFESDQRSICRADELHSELKRLMAGIDSQTAKATERAYETLQTVASNLNLTGEDLRTPPRLVFNAPILTSPTNKVRLDEDGLWAACKRFFGAGGHRFEDHLDASRAKKEFKEAFVGLRHWTRRTLRPTVLSHCTESSRPLGVEIEQQLLSLRERDHDQSVREMRVRVATELADLFMHIPQPTTKVQAAPSKPAPVIIFEEPTSPVAVHPVALSIIKLGAHAQKKRLGTLRNHILRKIEKVHGQATVENALAVGFDEDSLERFATLFWTHLPGIPTNGWIEMPVAIASCKTKHFAVSALGKQKNDVFLNRRLANYLSNPCTLFLLVDAAEIGSAQNQLKRSGIFQQLQAQIAVVLVLQNVRGLLAAKALAEAVLCLYDAWQQDSNHPVVAVLANNPDAQLSCAVSELFSRGHVRPVLHDAQIAFTAAVNPNGLQCDWLDSLIQNWRDFRNTEAV